MSPWCGPRICGFSFSADVAKILPTGALLKNGLRNDCTALLFSTAGSLERLPVCLKMYSSDAGDVRNLISSHASCWCFDCFGTARKDPPQLPPPPGTAAMFQLPFV